MGSGEKKEAAIPSTAKNVAVRMTTPNSIGGSGAAKCAKHKSNVASQTPFRTQEGGEQMGE